MYISDNLETARCFPCLGKFLIWLEDADLAKAVRCPQLMIPAQNDDASATEHQKNDWPLDCWYADMPLRATDVEHKKLNHISSAKSICSRAEWC